MSDAKAGAGAGAAPVPGPPPGPPPRPLPENPLLGTSNKQPAVTGNSQTNIGVLGQSLGGPGVSATDGVFGLGQNGVHGQATVSGGSGVLGEYMGPGNGDGVLGAGPNGVHGKSAAPGGNGVLAENSSTGTGLSGTSHQGHGVHGTNGGGSGLVPQYGAGVWGDSDFGCGVYGASKTNPGVQGISSNFEGVHGESQSAGHPGVVGINNSGGVGVYGFSSLLDGVQGISAAKDHAGVSGTNNSGGDEGMGVYGYSTGSDGVRGISATQAHAGVSGSNTSGGIGVWGASNGEAGHFEGTVTINGMLAHNGDGHCSGTWTVANDIVLLGLGQDCAEQFDVSEPEQLEPGTVVVIDREGALRESYAAYDKKVAGVVSGAGPCRPGIVLGKRPSEAPSATVALVGRVYCKVDAHYSPIDVGDLLTTSATPGYAMRADDPQKAFGAVIGKSLERLEAGRGLIPILVALQ